MPLYIEAGYDVADVGVGTYNLGVIETGGNSFSATVASGQYFLRSTAAAATGDDSASVAGYTSMIAAIETQLNAGTGGGAYTVTFSTTTNRVTITHDGAGGVTAVALDPAANGRIIGHTAVKTGALTHVMDVTPDYWINGAIGMWSGMTEREVDKDLSFTTISHSGKTTGLSRNTTATELDLTVALEPRAIVYTDHSVAADPWTWQALFRHARVVEPLLIDDAVFQSFVHLREAAFSPRPLSRDYVGHYDIALKTYLAARIIL